MQKVGLNTKAASVAAFNLEETEMASKSSWRTSVSQLCVGGKQRNFLRLFFPPLNYCDLGKTFDFYLFENQEKSDARQNLSWSRECVRRPDFNWINWKDPRAEFPHVEGEEEFELAGQFWLSFIAV